MINTIEIKKSEQFMITAKELSEIIKSLPISTEANNKLIAAILYHVDVGRKDAYYQAIKDINSTELIYKLKSELERMKYEN